jgi:hypothetical protein
MEGEGLESRPSEPIAVEDLPLPCMLSECIEALLSRLFLIACRVGDSLSCLVFALLGGHCRR